MDDVQLLIPINKLAALGFGWPAPLGFVWPAPLVRIEPLLNITPLSGSAHTHRHTLMHLKHMMIALLGLDGLNYA